MTTSTSIPTPTPTPTPTRATTPTTALDPHHVHTTRCWWDLHRARWACPAAPVLSS